MLFTGEMNDSVSVQPHRTRMIALASVALVSVLFAAVALGRPTSAFPSTCSKKSLGHASMETTRGYLHPDDRDLASAEEQGNAFLSLSGQKRQNACSTPSTRGI